MLWTACRAACIVWSWGLGSVSCWVQLDVLSIVEQKSEEKKTVLETVKKVIGGYVAITMEFPFAIAPGLSRYRSSELFQERSSGCDVWAVLCCW